MQEFVILVDTTDKPIGEMEKLEAHEKGQLHRALSVLIFNQKGEIMMQQRAYTKYHTPGLWSNTCCSHPRPDEDSYNAATRRLMEEMGIETSLQKKFEFIYKAEFGNGLTEHEFDHVFFGTYNDRPKLNPIEANDYKWATPSAIKADMSANPDHYTIWFRIIMEKIEENYPELFYS